jgi:hypothetical protein
MLQKITIKELQYKMAISRSAAATLYRDIKREYKTPIVTLSHVHDYLNIPVPQNM